MRSQLCAWVTKACNLPPAFHPSQICTVPFTYVHFGSAQVDYKLPREGNEGKRPHKSLHPRIALILSWGTQGFE